MKKIIAAIGLCGLMLSPSVSCMIENPVENQNSQKSNIFYAVKWVISRVKNLFKNQVVISIDPTYETKNGLTGLNRDIVLKLLETIDSNKTRAVIGMCLEHYRWKNHFYFINTHLGNCVNSKKVSLEFDKNYYGDYDFYTICYKKKDIYRCTIHKSQKIRDLFENASKPTDLEILAILGNASKPTDLEIRDLFENVSKPTDNDDNSNLLYLIDMYECEKSLTIALLLNTVTANEFTDDLERKAATLLLVDVWTDHNTKYRRRSYGPLLGLEHLASVPANVLNRVVIFISPCELKQIFSTPQMRMRLLEITPLAIRACYQVQDLSHLQELLIILRNLFSTLFKETDVPITKQHEITNALTWAVAATIDHTNKETNKLQAMLDTETHKPEAEQNREAIKSLEYHIKLYKDNIRNLRN